MARIPGRPRMGREVGPRMLQPPNPGRWKRGETAIGAGPKTFPDAEKPLTAQMRETPQTLTGLGKKLKK